MAINFAPGAGRGRNPLGKNQVRIQGLEKLTSEFKRISSKSDSIMTKEIHRAAERIAERANRDVPIDTGRLLRSIDVKKWTRRASVNVSAPYAGFVEFGTSNKNYPKQPYIIKHIKPSIDRMIENIKRLIA